MIKKYVMELKVVENIRLHSSYCLLKLTSGQSLPEMIPGQFVQVLIENAPHTFLRRPMSINYVDKKANELWLLIQLVGEGTRWLSKVEPGETMNVILPLGNGFSVPRASVDARLLLIGGGAGTAPMLFWGETLKSIGFRPAFLLGARTKEDIMQLTQFEEIGMVYVTTEDGSMGEKGYVTNHSILREKKMDMIYTCGPKPMMVAVAQYAKAGGITCEVSLENMMACGIGACLCCVENTIRGHVCICTEGPVFNINQLIWQI